MINVVFLEDVFANFVFSGQQGSSEGENKQTGVSYRDREAITFLLDFLRRSPSFRVNLNFLQAHLIAFHAYMYKKEATS